MVINALGKNTSGSEYTSLKGTPLAPKDSVFAQKKKLKKDLSPILKTSKKTIKNLGLANTLDHFKKKVIFKKQLLSNKVFNCQFLKSRKENGKKKEKEIKTVLGEKNVQTQEKVDKKV